MRILKAAMARIVLLSAAIFASYAALLAIPQPLFSYSVRANNLVLHSDLPFSEAAARNILQLAAKKLERSPLYSPQQPHSVFVCNARWRQMLLFNKDYGVGGVAQYPVTPQVFLREARIEDNRLISPHGDPVM